MEQLQQVQKDQEEVITEVSIGNAFSEYLILKGEKKGKNFLPDFDKLSRITLVSIDKKPVDRNGVIGGNSHPAKVSEILRLRVKPTQEVTFLPWLAGG